VGVQKGILASKAAKNDKAFRHWLINICYRFFANVLEVVMGFCYAKDALWSLGW
jgi:hypothetical protein